MLKITRQLAQIAALSTQAAKSLPLTSWLVRASELRKNSSCRVKTTRKTRQAIPTIQTFTSRGRKWIGLPLLSNAPLGKWRRKLFLSIHHLAIIELQIAAMSVTAAIIKTTRTEVAMPRARVPVARKNSVPRTISAKAYRIPKTPMITNILVVLGRSRKPFVWPVTWIKNASSAALAWLGVVPGTAPSGSYRVGVRRWLLRGDRLHLPSPACAGFRF